jgi:hypothetical protein
MPMLGGTSKIARREETNAQRGRIREERGRFVAP